MFSIYRTTSLPGNSPLPPPTPFTYTPQDPAGSHLLPSRPPDTFLHLTSLMLQPSSGGWICYFIHQDVWIAKRTFNLSLSLRTRNTQTSRTSPQWKCYICHIWKIKVKCGNGLGGAHKQYFRALVTQRQDCFALWGKQNHNLVAYNAQSDIALRGKDVPKTQGGNCFHRIRPFYYPLQKLLVYGNFRDWVGHVADIKRSLKQGLTRKLWQHRLRQAALSTHHACVHASSLFLVLVVRENDWLLVKAELELSVRRESYECRTVYTSVTLL